MSKKTSQPSTVKKLSLEKRTLRRLDDQALQQVAGGTLSRGRPTTDKSNSGTV